MLKAKAEIQFTLHGRNYRGGKHFRPVFKFGDGLLFSGSIISENDEYIYNKPYTVDIEFFTIENEAYNALLPILQPGMGITIQEGSKITGIATLLDYTYVA